MGAKPSVAGTNNNPSKGKNTSEDSSLNVDQLSHGVAVISLDSGQNGGGDWEVYVKSSNYRAGSSAAKPLALQSSNTKAWGHLDVVQKLGMQSNGGSGRAPGDTWPTQNLDPKKAAGGGYSRPQASNNFGQGKDDSHSLNDHFEFDKDDDVDDDDNDDFDAMDDDDDYDAMDDDDDLLSDEFDSDSSEKSHETLKRSKWFKKFFDTLDSLSVEEINAPARQWHCPACLGGPGATDWYVGLLPLMTHAKTKGSKRVTLHRELAELLDEELRRRGISIIPAGKVFGKWEGLKDGEKDHEIVWPPMVVIMNTMLEQDESGKWIGMGNQELLDYFNSYAAVKTRHAYGPQGHRGISVLIFESSARGYIEAERLHKNFYEQGIDRRAWEFCRILFHPGGKRQLYGYMAVKEDLDIFYLHSQGKSNKLKFQMRSYHEMVTNQIWQMSEDNQQLIYLKNRIVKEQRHSKALQESFDRLSKMLRKTLAENRIVTQRTKMQHEQNKVESVSLLRSSGDSSNNAKHKGKKVKTSWDHLVDRFGISQIEEMREMLIQCDAQLGITEERKKREGWMTDLAVIKLFLGMDTSSGGSNSI